MNADHRNHDEANARRLADEVRDLATPPPDPLFRARLCADFISGTIAETNHSRAGRPRPKPGSIGLWVGVPAVMATLVALVVLTGDGPRWEVTAAEGGGVVTAGSGVVAVADRADLENLVAAGGEFETGSDVTLDVRWRDIVALSLAPGTRVTLPSPEEAAMRKISVALALGEASVRTGAGFAGHSLIVTTAEGEATVTGTAFDVYKNSEVTCVCVVEGEVDIRDATGDIERVPAGMRKVMFADGREAQVLPLAPEHADAIKRFFER
jgi:ferric-dicitrate binding protein FerR (iron transport regulator)